MCFLHCQCWFECIQPLGVLSTLSMLVVNVSSDIPCAVHWLTKGRCLTQQLLGSVEIYFKYAPADWYTARTLLRVNGTDVLMLASFRKL